MISALIATRDSAAVLGPTLAALAEGLTAGMLRDVVFADAGSTDDTAEIAELSGANFVRAEGPAFARAQAAAAATRGDWLLLLDADAVLAPGWPEAARRRLSAAPAAPARFALRVAGRPHGGALLLRARPALGLVIPRAALDAPGFATRGAARIDAALTIGREGWRARGGTFGQAGAAIGLGLYSAAADGVGGWA